ncbi:MAG: hypothetical protein ABJB12_19150 [Pseudomonadota bacterium]
MMLARLSLSVLSLASMAACAKRTDAVKASVNAAPSASALAAANASASTRPLPTSVPHVVPGMAACRALEVVGRATVEGTPIALGSLLDGKHWVELQTGASVALRHTVTSREFRLIGPGTILPCRNGAEQILVAAGRVSTSANLGVRPGAEVLIATPSGSVRYGDAGLELELGPKRLQLRVKQGEAWLEPEAQGNPKFKNPVRSGAEARLTVDHALPSTRLAACQSSAQKARESAELVLAPGTPGSASSLGARAAAQMRDRAAARTACAMAAAEAGVSQDPAERQRLSASVAHADELWQSVPPAVAGQKN